MKKDIVILGLMLISIAAMGQLNDAQQPVQGMRMGHTPPRMGAQTDSLATAMRPIQRDSLRTMGGFGAQREPGFGNGNPQVQNRGMQAQSHGMQARGPGFGQMAQAGRGSQQNVSRQGIQGLQGIQQGRQGIQGRQPAFNQPGNQARQPAFNGQSNQGRQQRFNGQAAQGQQRINGQAAQGQQRINGQAAQGQQRMFSGNVQQRLPQQQAPRGGMQGIASVGMGGNRSGGMANPEQRIDQRISELTKSLNLTPEQASKIAKIQKNQAKKEIARYNKVQKRLTAVEKKQLTTQNKIKSVLTEEQRATFESQKGVSGFNERGKKAVPFRD